jgi:curved DNA-binding protein
MKNPYSILGLEKSATDADIKKAYRSLAMIHHPDKGGDSEKFKEITEAYNILSDPKKKTQYDSNSSFGRYYDTDDQFFNEFLKAQGFADMFNDRYGWSQSGKGSNIKTEIFLTLEEAYYGVKRELRLALKTISVTIKPGIKNGQKLRLKGLGQKGLTDDLNGDLILTINIVNHPNFMLDERGLHKVHTIDMFNAILGGKSVIDVFDKKISFTIPPGTQNGSMLRLVGKGYPIYDQSDKYSDLYIKVIVELPNDLTSDELLSLTTLKNKIDERRRRQ